MELKRLFDFLTKQVIAQPNRAFLSTKVVGAEGKVWKSYSFAEVQAETNRVSQLLLNLGLKAGDKIALVSANRPEWNFVDLGALQVGVIVVPMYPTISEKDYEFIFNDSTIQYAFIGDAGIFKRVKPLLHLVPSLKGIYTFEQVDGIPNLDAVAPKLEAVDESAIDARKHAVNGDDLATIIYTSGTTGNPKGVMLSHKNIVSNLTSVTQIIPFNKNEKALSFLPLCHSFERAVFYAYTLMGIHIYYAESLEAIGENLKEVQPYCITTVPRLLEKVYEKIMVKGNELTGIKRKLFFWSMALGARYELGLNQGWVYNLQLSIARKLVFSKWQEALGGRMEFIFVGAAAMQGRLIKLFAAAGVTVIEGYGLTETSPVLTANRMDETERCVGTVGYAIPGVAVKLADDGEIIAQGPNVMLGYYNRPDLTAEVIDENGWFHTGDIGVWVKYHGKDFLKITDRKKELFKTSGGKYVAPQVIENKMKESRYIEQIMVVGNDQKFVAALIVPSFANLQDWAKENGLNFTSNEQIVNDEKVKELISKEVNHYNVEFGKWEQVKKFSLMSTEWTIETGELTPTLKLKRKVIMALYSNDINDLYKD